MIEKCERETMLFFGMKEERAKFFGKEKIGQKYG